MAAHLSRALWLSKPAHASLLACVLSIELCTGFTYQVYQSKESHFTTMILCAAWVLIPVPFEPKVPCRVW